MKEDIKKFKIPISPETTTKSIRFPNDLLGQVETLLSGKNCSFTAFVVEAVRVAMTMLDEDEVASASGDAKKQEEAQHKKRGRPAKEAAERI